jgi:predicted RNA-binding Zn-ribbon protein involved in translation (DUF1610 family)
MQAHPIIAMLTPAEWGFAALVIVAPLILWRLVNKLPQEIFDPASFLANKQCGACGRNVSLASMSGQKCPHCGVYWSYESTHKNWTTKQTQNVTATIATIVGLIGFVVMAVLFYRNVINIK